MKLLLRKERVKTASIKLTKYIKDDSVSL